MLRRALYPLLALAALTALLAACGGNEDAGGDAAVASIAETGEASGGESAPASSGEETAASKDRDQAMVDFARCLRQHGVDVEDPKPGEGLRMTFRREDGDPDTMETAQKECQKHLRGAIGEPSAADRARMREAGVAYARCMREHGVDMPDPKADGGIMIAPGSGLDPDDPSFQKAEKACEGILREAAGGAAPMQEESR